MKADMAAAANGGEEEGGDQNEGAAEADPYEMETVIAHLLRTLLDDHGIRTNDAMLRTTALNLGFSVELLDTPVKSLSGGWAMRVSLARASLARAELLLLDEPTNHLDVHAVKWLEDYLNSEANRLVTVVVVSHDPSFLDHVATDIIQMEGKALTNYEGNFSDFKEKHPQQAHTYLAAAGRHGIMVAGEYSLNFPKPTRLDGVGSNTKAVLKISHVDFAYPTSKDGGAAKNILTDADVKLTQQSRIAVLGGNGAGKSTLIKLLVGELEPGQLSWNPLR